MDTLETLETLNDRLIEYFGIDTGSNNPMFRIVWSEDQYEKRQTFYTKEGFELPYPIVAELPKYPYIKERYLLERFVMVPEWQQNELAGVKVSYEPLWVFQDRHGFALAPKWEACQLVIDTLYAALGKASLAQYKPTEEEQNDKTGQAIRVNKLEKELFGNETETGDALAHGQAIVVPRNYEKNELN